MGHPNTESLEKYKEGYVKCDKCGVSSCEKDDDLVQLPQVARTGDTRVNELE